MLAPVRVFARIAAVAHRATAAAAAQAAAGAAAGCFASAWGGRPSAAVSASRASAGTVGASCMAGASARAALRLSSAWAAMTHTPALSLPCARSRDPAVPAAAAARLLSRLPRARLSSTWAAGSRRSGSPLRRQRTATGMPSTATMASRRASGRPESDRPASRWLLARRKESWLRLLAGGAAAAGARQLDQGGHQAGCLHCSPALAAAVRQAHDQCHSAGGEADAAGSSPGEAQRRPRRGLLVPWPVLWAHKVAERLRASHAHV